MLYYLNNATDRDNASIYGAEAIYDLWADGMEDKFPSQKSSRTPSCAAENK